MSAGQPIRSTAVVASGTSDRRYVVDDHLVTTTGVTASLPVSLFLIERIAGRRVADSVARSMGVATWDTTHESAGDGTS